MSGERNKGYWVWLDDEGRPIPGASCTVREPGTSTSISETLYAFDGTDASTLANPFTTSASGEAEFYLTYPKRVDLFFSKSGYTSQTVPLDVTAATVGTARFAIKAADETVNNSATLQNDDDLHFAIGKDEIGYTETWEFVGIVFVTTASSGTPDIKVAFTVPVGSTLLWFGQGWNSAISAITSTVQTSSGSSQVLGVSNTGNLPIVVRGIVTTVDISGTLQLQWAQNTATAENTKVIAGSYLKATRIA